jgi:hypothetical protein
VSLILLILVVLIVRRYWTGRGYGAAAEMRASGELKSPLYWTYNALGIGVLAIICYIVKAKPAETGLWWLLVAGLIVVTLFVRRALTWRYPHP